jgi:TonB-dependent siderophore receptor
MQIVRSERATRGVVLKKNNMENNAVSRPFSCACTGGDRHASNTHQAERKFPPRMRPLCRAMLGALSGWALGAASATAPSTAQAQNSDATDPAATRSDYDIVPAALATALERFTQQSGITVSTAGAPLDDIASPGVRGNYSAQEALARLVRGSGYIATRSSAGFVLSPLGGSRPADELVVVGFRAREQGSATKTALSIRDTPQSISVTTRQSMEARQVRDLTSALELTAGLTSGVAADGGPFAGRGLGGGEGFLMRGNYLDGRRDVRMDGFVVASRVFDMVAFERIEVVKGPSSVLYGQGSLGGFINMIRRKPETERSASIVAQIGSFDTYRGEVDLTGAVGAGDRARGRITAAYDSSGSFTDHVDTRMWVIAPSLALDIGEDTTVLAQLLYQRDDYTPSRGMPLRLEGDRLFIPDIPRSLFTGVPSQEESFGEVYLATVELDKPLGDKWLMSLLFQKSGVSTERFFDAYSNACCLDTSGAVYMYSDTARAEGDSWAGEIRFDGRFEAFGREHRVLLGFEHAQRDDDLAFGYTYLGLGNLYSRDFQADAVLPGGAGNQDFDFDFTNDNFDQGAYGQLLMSVTDRARLLLGARFDSSEIDHLNNNTGQLDTKSDNEWTMRVGLTYDLSDSTTAFAVLAQTFNPTVDARSESGRILDPETGEGLEFGMKTEWFDGRLGASLAVFRQELDNIPITDPANDNFSINGGLQRTDGVEIEASGLVSDGLTVGAALAWLDSEYVDPRDPNYGMKPWGLIDRQASLFGSYELQHGRLEGLGFGASYVDVGKRTQLGDQFLPGYRRVDLNFYYNGLEHWEFSLQVRNVGDERYVERLRDQYQDNFFGAPRALLFRSEYRF